MDEFKKKIMVTSYGGCCCSDCQPSPLIRRLTRRRARAKMKEDLQRKMREADEE